MMKWNCILAVAQLKILKIIFREFREKKLPIQNIIKKDWSRKKIVWKKNQEDEKKSIRAKCQKMKELELISTKIIYTLLTPGNEH